jgi:hypothetical protein
VWPDGADDAGTAMISRGLVVLGLATAGYSFWVIAAIAGGC